LLLIEDITRDKTYPLKKDTVLKKIEIQQRGFRSKYIETQREKYKNESSKS